LKLLWSSNAPFVATGYGQQTEIFTSRIQALGHDVALLAYYGLNGAPLEWNGLKIYPGSVDNWGNDVLAAYAAHHFGGGPRDGWTITLQDVWTLVGPTLKELRLASWTPVDHDPVPPAVVGYFQRFGAVPIAMSRFGEDRLRAQDLNPLYVPHGVETDIFKSNPERMAIREALGMPQDAFVVGIVAANKGMAPPRKGWPEMFEAFARFREKRKDALLYVHSLRTESHGGCNLQYLARNVGLDPDKIMWVDQFRYVLGNITKQDMAALYSTMDVLLNTSYGEGFGIPIIEAQACGVPVIVTDATSMPELCGSGWVVPAERMWDEHHKAFYGRPIVAEIITALEKAYHASAIRHREARKFALGYDADRVLQEYWVPALGALQEVLEPSEIQAEPVQFESVGV
jgi:glycosyltransferase involved in cell wall biosynthesis